MELAHQAHEQCYALVGRYLSQSFGELVTPTSDEPAYRVEVGHVIYVAVNAAGEDSAVIDLYSWVGRGLEVTPEIARFLLEFNDRTRFGMCSIDEDGDIPVTYSMVGDHVAKDGLARVVASVAYGCEDPRQRAHRAVSLVPLRSDASPYADARCPPLPAE